MRSLLALWVVAALAQADPCAESSLEASYNPYPFAGSPRGYGIPFPQLIKTYFSGVVMPDASGYIELANEQYQNGRTVLISLTDTAVSIDKAREVDVKVADFYSFDPARPTPPGSIIERHPDELALRGTPRAITLNTSNLSGTAKAMIAIPGNFRVRVGSVKSCQLFFLPFAEFGFSTLPWREPGTIKLISVSPAAPSFPAWPKTLSLKFSAPISIHDVRQMRYELTSLENPKDVRIFSFDKLGILPLYLEPLLQRRRLLAVAPTPDTPCLSFCESDPMSEACYACCTGVVHEKPWDCGEDSQVKCCKEWTPDCWDTPSEKNRMHSCNMCNPRVTLYEPPDFITIEDDTLTIDHRILAIDGTFAELRKVLLHSNVLVNLVLGRGAIVDGFSRSQPAIAGSHSFQVARQAKRVQLVHPIGGYSVPTFPPWINLTIPAQVTWRCTSDVRGFGLRHSGLAGGQVMHPGDLCRMLIVRDSPPPSVPPPSTQSPTWAPTTAMPTATPTTSAPTASPTAPSSAPTASPTTLAPTATPTIPTVSPTTLAPTLSPTWTPTAGPTISDFAPRTIPCDNDGYWPQECPFPQYLRLIFENNVTTLAVNTQDELFRQDFPDLERMTGMISVSVDRAALITMDGTNTPIETPSEDPYFVVAPSINAGMALTRGGLRLNVGRNIVIIPPGTIADTAVIEAAVVTPPLVTDIPAPVSDTIRIVVYTDNNTVAEIQNLAQPVQMIIPIPESDPVVAKTWSPCQQQVYYHDPTCVWWSEAHNDWSTAGCSTDNRNSSETVCYCNHLTDFAVLAALESCQEVDPLPYYVFAGPFFCIFLYCMWAIGMLVWYRNETKKPGFGSLVGQHTLMAIASMARALGPLAVLPGATAGSASALFAIPYLAKFPSFLLLVFQWATIVHFAMQTGGGRKYMMPAWAVFCVLTDLTVAGVFIYFHVTKEILAVLAGTITLAVLAALFSLGFLVYAYSLARQFPKDVSASNTQKRLGLRSRVQLGGFSFAVLFMLEAACHPAALYLQQQGVQDGLLGATCVFLLAEFLSYCIILWLFYPALSSHFTPRMARTTETELVSANSTRKGTAV